MDHIIGGKFKLGGEIDMGSYDCGFLEASFYVGTNIESGEEFAVIKQSVEKEHPNIRDESEWYKLLQGGTGIPHFEWFGVEGDYNVMVVERLGRNLDDLLWQCRKKFSLKTVLMLADQMLDRVEYMHDRGFLHRRITPRNFRMGLGRRSNQVYILTYLFTKEYRDLQTHEHIPYLYSEKENIIGSPLYASVNVHLGVEQSRRDDLESLGYVLMHFLRGSLPWHGCPNNEQDDQKKMVDRIRDKKALTPIEVLCESYPPEFISYFYYCRSLQFDDMPDYSYLKRLFSDLFIRKGYQYDNIFDWTERGDTTSVGSGHNGDHSKHKIEGSNARSKQPQVVRSRPIRLPSTEPPPASEDEEIANLALAIESSLRSAEAEGVTPSAWMLQ